MDEKLIKNKYYRAYMSIPRMQQTIDHEREVNHKLYEYAKTLEQTIKMASSTYVAIRELTKDIVIVNGKPCKNTSKKECYEVLEKIQEIVGSNK